MDQGSLGGCAGVQSFQRGGSDEECKGIGGLGG